MTFSAAFDTDGWLQEMQGEVSKLEVDAGIAAYEAAEAGVQAARYDHPYQDHTYMLTDTATATKGAIVSEAFMHWVELYASFVNDGTERSNPYPFVPIALRAAELSLTRRLDAILQRFISRVQG